MKATSILLVFGISLLLVCSYAADEGEFDPEQVDTEKVDYAKGSVCQYCEYCTFCKLCDADCPCETSSSQPNCKLCKYCKFCYLCSAMCDTICKPGGVLDTVSAAIVNALPSYNKEEIKGDLDSVKSWLDKTDKEDKKDKKDKKDEL